MLRLPVLPRIDFEASPIKVHVVIEESSQQIMYCNLHVRKYLKTRNKPDNIYKKKNNIRVNHDNTLNTVGHVITKNKIAQVINETTEKLQITNHE